MYVTRTFCRQEQTMRLRLLLSCRERFFKLTLMQPTMVVVNAELYCVHSTVEYIRMKLKRRKCVHITTWQQEFHNGDATLENRVTANVSQISSADRPQIFGIIRMLNVAHAWRAGYHLTPWHRTGGTGRGKAHQTSPQTLLPGSRNGV